MSEPRGRWVMMSSLPRLRKKGLDVSEVGDDHLFLTLPGCAVGLEVEHPQGVEQHSLTAGYGDLSVLHSVVDLHTLALLDRERIVWL